MIEMLYTSNTMVNAAVIGIGATAIMDLWALFLFRTFGIKPLNFALVGRWLCYMPQGIFKHQSIGATKPMTNEATVGWFAHYFIGIIFAVIFVLVVGNGWLEEPTIFSALIFGALTVVFPYFIMQPSFGLGVGAAKTPNPKTARIRSFLTHLAFGLGLYFSACLLAFTVS